MAKNKISDYSATNSSNSDVGGINIAEGCPAPVLNNAQREVMAHLASWQDGTDSAKDTASFGDPSDLTKRVRLDAGNVPTATTRALYAPVRDGTIALTPMVTTKSATYTLLAADNGGVFEFDGAYTASLTAAATLGNGWSATILARGGAVTIDPNGAEEIEGDATLTIADGDEATIYCNGTSFRAVEIKAASSLLDEDDFASDSATQGATQQSSKAYIASQISAIPTATGAPNALLQDQKTNGTTGGASVTGTWQTRTLNTKVYDPDSLITLSANRFTPSEDGWVTFSVPYSSTSGHKARLRNITDGTTDGVGTTARNASTGDTSWSMCSAPVVAGKQYEIQHRTDAAYVFGLGYQCSSGEIEIYTTLEFWRT